MGQNNVKNSIRYYECFHQPFNIGIGLFMYMASSYYAIFTVSIWSIPKLFLRKTIYLLGTGDKISFYITFKLNAFIIMRYILFHSM